MRFSRSPEPSYKFCHFLGILTLTVISLLEKEMATHSSILAWRIPWTEEPGGLQSTGSQRVGHDWASGSPGLSISFSSTFLSYPIPQTYTSIYLAATDSSMPSFNSPKHYQYQVVHAGSVRQCVHVYVLCVSTGRLGWWKWDRLLDNFKVPDVLPAWINCCLPLLPVSLVSSDIAGSPLQGPPSHSPSPNGFHN